MLINSLNSPELFATHPFSVPADPHAGLLEPTYPSCHTNGQFRLISSPINMQTPRRKAGAEI